MTIYADDSGSGGSGNPIEVTIDITGKTVIDMTGKENADIVNLVSSNPLENVWQIINTTSLKNIAFRAYIPTINFNDQTSGGAPAGANLRLASNIQTTNGLKAGYIQIQKRILISGTSFYGTEFLDAYF